jgi:toxin CcdB
MQQFDLCRIRSEGVVRLAIVLQHDWLSDQKTIVVAPAMPTTDYKPLSKLHPVFEFEGVPHLVALDLVMTVQRVSMGPVVAELRHLRDAIKRGLDTLFDGF